MALQPQTPAHPTQPTVVTSVKQKRWVPRFALEYPCNPPPPPLAGRPPRARVGDFKGGEGNDTCASQSVDGDPGICNGRIEGQALECRELAQGQIVLAVWKVLHDEVCAKRQSNSTV